MTLIKPIAARGSLKDEVVRALKAAILVGEISAHEVLTISKLAEQFGVSRTPIREAVLELQTRGLVEVERGIGFKVITPTHKEMRDIYEARQLIEPGAMRMIRTPSDGLVEELQELCGLMEKVSVNEDLVAFLDLDQRFHVKLIECTGNTRLAALVSDLRDAQRLPGLNQVVTAEALRHRNAMHVGMLDALLAGRAEEAARLISRHIALSYEDWERTRDENQVEGYES